MFRLKYNICDFDKSSISPTFAIGMFTLRKIIFSIHVPYFRITYLDIIMTLSLGVKAFPCLLHMTLMIQWNKDTLVITANK